MGPRGRFADKTRCTYLWLCVRGSNHACPHAAAIRYSLMCAPIHVWVAQTSGASESRARAPLPRSRASLDAARSRRANSRPGRDGKMKIELVAYYSGKLVRTRNPARARWIIYFGRESGLFWGVIWENVGSRLFLEVATFFTMPFIIPSVAGNRDTRILCVLEQR